MLMGNIHLGWGLALSSFINVISPNMVSYPIQSIVEVGLYRQTPMLNNSCGYILINQYDFALNEKFLPGEV